eukprot:407966_1
MGLGPSTSDFSEERKILYPDIQQNFRLNEEKNLKFKFVVRKRHPEMLIFKNDPKYDEDPVVAVDMVYKTVQPQQQKIRLNVVRCQGQTYGKFINNIECKVDDDSHTLGVSLTSIVEFCFNYQHQNQIYSTDSQNCRRFMIALCNHAGVTWSSSYPCEELWYSARGCTNSGDDNQKIEIQNAREMLAN